MSWCPAAAAAATDAVRLARSLSSQASAVGLIGECAWTPRSPARVVRCALAARAVAL